MVDFKERTRMFNILLEQFEEEDNALANYQRSGDLIDTILATRGAIATTNIGKLFELYKTCITDSREHQQRFQRKFTVAQAKEGKRSISTEFLNNERKEAKCHSATRIRAINRSARSSNGIGFVTVPNAEGELIEMSNNDPLEKALLNFYDIKVTQSNTRPFMQISLLSFVSSIGINKNVEQVLNGDAQIQDDVNQKMAEVMKDLALKEGTELHHQPTHITVEEVKDWWKGCKDRTSSAGHKHPNTHVVHWKV